MNIFRIILNLSDGNHIRIVWSFRNAIKTYNVNKFHKNLTTGSPVAKTLIKYNNNHLVENKEENELINIELTEQKQILIMMKMLLTLDD